MKLKNIFIMKQSDSFGVTACKILFWIWMIICFLIGSSESITTDRCVISRVAELTPTYLIGCGLFGKRLPDFEF